MKKIGAKNLFPLGSIDHFPLEDIPCLNFQEIRLGIKDRMGVFWSIDKDGCLVNDAKFHKIQPEFEQLIDLTRKTFVESLGNSMHSCYLTGSIPRGLAVKGLSDLDAFAILKKGKTDQGQEVRFKAINSQRFSRVTDAQLEVWKWKDVFRAEMDDVTEHQVILKLNSLCIYGENLAQYIAPIKPDVALANTEVFQFKLDVEEMLNAIRMDGSPENVIFWSKRIIKNLVRAGFYMTIPNEKKYTRNLNLCAKIFLKTYPEKTEFLECLDIFDAPFSEVLQLKKYFESGFGAWFLKETERWLEKHNPKRLPYLKRNPNA